MTIRHAVSRAWGAMSWTTRGIVVAIGGVGLVLAASPIIMELGERQRQQRQDQVAADTRARVEAERIRRDALTPEQRAAEDAERAAKAAKAQAEREAAAAKVQAQKEKEVRQAALAAESKRLERKRQDVAWDVTRQFKAQLRDPESVRWHGVAANLDASAICLDYGEMNGFGGISRRQVVIIDYKINDSESAWNKHCTKPPLFDVKGFAP